MTTSFTRYFRFGLPDFNTEPWHDTWNTLVNYIDAVLFKMLLVQEGDLWKNSHAYVPGDFVVSPEDGSFWVNLVAHTSIAAPSTFTNDRTAHPSFWAAVASSTSSPTAVIPTIITVGGLGVVNEQFVVLNKTVAAATAITLPSVAARSGNDLIIVDWAGNAGDITVTPNGAETIMGLASWVMASVDGFGFGARVRLTPNTTLNGWIVTGV